MDKEQTNMQKNKASSKDIQLSKLMKVSDKLTQGCIIVTVLTAILCVIKIITAIEAGFYFEGEYLISRNFVLDIVTTVLILSVEVFVCIVASNLSSLAELILKNDNTAESCQNNKALSTQWECPACGKSNENYVGTCGCGEEKPN